MCIAIFLPQGETIPFEHLVEGQKHNPDGCGLAWVEGGEIQTFKSMEFSEFTTVYNSILERCGNINMLIHFRITSRGKTSVEMCHPFMVGEDICIIHNGTISSIKQTETANGDSDTKVLAEQILAQMPLGWESNAACHRLIEEFCGWSKICILTKDDEVYIINEKSGNWENNVWYSNKSYVSYTRQVTTTNKNVTVYTPPNDKYDPSDRFWGDTCDECHHEFSYASMKMHKCKLLCQTCLWLAEKDEKFVKDVMKDDSKLKKGAEVYRPCACCRTLIKREELWHLEIDFMSDIEEMDVLVGFVPELMTPHATYADIATCHVCEDCYMNLMVADNYPESVLSITVLDMPDAYEDGSDTKLKQIN